MERLRTEPKQKNRTIPAGARVIDKNISTTVEEIENGYLVVRTLEIHYEHEGEKHWDHFTRKRYSKNNPVKVDKNIMLADNFE